MPDDFIDVNDSFINSVSKNVFECLLNLKGSNLRYSNNGSYYQVANDCYELNRPGQN